MSLLLYAIGAICILLSFLPWTKRPEPDSPPTSVVYNNVFDGTVGGPETITKHGVVVITKDQIVINGFIVTGSPGDFMGFGIIREWTINQLINYGPTVFSGDHIGLHDNFEGGNIEEDKK